MAIGIDPLIDYAFKMLFGSDDHKSLTISLINTVLIGQPPVTDITFPFRSQRIRCIVRHRWSVGAGFSAVLRN